MLWDPGFCVDYLVADFITKLLSQGLVNDLESVALIMIYKIFYVLQQKSFRTVMATG